MYRPLKGPRPPGYRVFAAGEVVPMSGGPQVLFVKAGMQIRRAPQTPS
jgi:hypothetical protein